MVITVNIISLIFTSTAWGLPWSRRYFILELADPYISSTKNCYKALNLLTFLFYVHDSSEVATRNFNTFTA